MSPVLISAVAETSKLLRNDHEAALPYLESALTPATLADPQVRTGLRSLLVSILLKLENYDQAERVAIEILEQDAEVDVQVGLYVFGAKSAVKQILESYVKAESNTRLLDFGNRVLELHPEWLHLDNHLLAAMWTMIGNAYAKSDLQAAIEAWKRSRACWISKDKLWAAAEPDAFEKWKGLDRYNPLQVDVEAKLFGSYLRLKKQDEAQSILMDWATQLTVIGSAHSNEPQFSQEVFRRSIWKAVKNAAKILEIPDLLDVVKVFRPHNECEAFLLPQIKGPLLGLL